MPRRYAPLSAEHRFWLRLLPGFLAPSAEPRGLLKSLHRAFVVPNVLFVSGSAEYQTYLALIFHRSTVARVGHFVCVPLGAGLLIATAHRIAPAMGLVVALMLTTWWVTVALVHRRGLWALLNAVAGAGIAALGLRYPASWVHPALPMIATAMLQSGSHATEIDLPPRVADASRWVALREFMAGPGTLGRVLFSVRQWLYGTFDEWWATPRLVHVGTLLALFRLGYAPDLRARLDTYVRDALASGDPALDYIGEGGGTYLDAQTLEPATLP